MTPRCFSLSTRVSFSEFIIKSERSFLACNGEHFGFWNIETDVVL